MKLQLLAVIVGIAAFVTSDAYAQVRGPAVRIGDGPQAAFHGGSSSAVVGINTAGNNSWNLNSFRLPSSGRIVTNASVSFQVFKNILNNSVHGSELDVISIHQLYGANRGWSQSSRSFIDGVEVSGGPTFNFQSQASETEGRPWKDVNGADVANFLGSFDPTPLDQVLGFNIGDDPDFVDFDIPVEIAQGWVDDPASFGGIVIVSNDNGDGMGRFLFVDDPGFLTIDTVAQFILGDVNLDGSADFLDINPFITALSGGEFKIQADIDGNGVVNFLDVAPFVAILSSF